MLALPLLQPLSPCFPAIFGLLADGAWNACPGLLLRCKSVVSGTPCWGAKPVADTRTNRKRAGTNVANARLDQKPLPSTTAGWLGIAVHSHFSCQGPVLDNSSCLEPSGSNSRLLALSCLGQPPGRLPTERTISPHLRGYSDSGSIGLLGKSLGRLRTLLAIALPTLFPFMPPACPPPG
jgi:hypothetical protein